MPYPSLIWNRPLSIQESGNEAVIPETVLKDLYLDEELRPKTLQVMRNPCTAEEIRMRQKLYGYFLGDGTRIERLCSLKEDIEAFERLLGRMKRAETENERVLLFLAVMKGYFAAAGKWAVEKDSGSRIGEIGQYFSELLRSESVSEAQRKCTEIFVRKPSELSLTVRGGQSYASEGRRMFKNRLEEIFTGMGLEDAVPADRHPSFAIPEITKAFTEVYAGYYESAKNFYNRYSGVFLDGENNIELINEYTDEIAYLADTVKYFEKLRDAGCPLCCPEIAEERMAELDSVGDPSLLRRGVNWGGIVPNDIRMYAEKGGERLNFFILSGANGGGKTTYLRSCGIAVLFFITGCPVAAERGKMYPFRSLYSHFPADESFDTGGRFVNEAARADEIMEKADEDSFVLFNETYSGTDENKSEEYASRLTDSMHARGTFGIFVTHIHALTGGKIPTLAAVIDEEDENRRTYKIRRVGGTDSSFAADILEKYNLDALSLKKRLGRFGKEGGINA